VEKNGGFKQFRAIKGHLISEKDWNRSGEELKIRKNLNPYLE